MFGDIKKIRLSENSEINCNNPDQVLRAIEIAMNVIEISRSTISTERRNIKAIKKEKHFWKKYLNSRHEGFIEVVAINKNRIAKSKANIRESKDQIRRYRKDLKFLNCEYNKIKYSDQEENNIKSIDDDGYAVYSYKKK